MLIQNIKTISTISKIYTLQQKPKTKKCYLVSNKLTFFKNTFNFKKGYFSQQSFLSMLALVTCKKLKCINKIRHVQL